MCFLLNFVRLQNKNKQNKQNKQSKEQSKEQNDKGMNLIRPENYISNLYLQIFNYSSFNYMQSSLFFQVFQSL